MKPLAPISSTARVVLGISFFVLFFLVWAAVTFGGLVPKTFLADPLTMVKSGWTLMVQHGFLGDVRWPRVEDLPRQSPDHGAGGH